MRAAFYDFDGTLAASNVVTRYFFFARRAPGLFDRLRRSAVTLGGVPYWLWLDSRSRKLFNEVFFRQFRGLRRDWLEQQAEALYTEEVRPKIYPGSAKMVRRDRDAGFATVLVTGGLDFELAPLARELGFDHLLANRMRFEGGVATGEIEPPLLAEQGKIEAMADLCRRYNVETTQSKAYSDSFSDAPMLEYVGLPAAVNPDARLKALAQQRGWPVLSTKER
ncbi:MAG: HAD family phosphatase [Bryobacterales bacterium]